MRHVVALCAVVFCGWVSVHGQQAAVQAAEIRTHVHLANAAIDRWNDLHDDLLDGRVRVAVDEWQAVRAEKERYVRGRPGVVASTMDFYGRFDRLFAVVDSLHVAVADLPDDPTAGERADHLNRLARMSRRLVRAGYDFSLAASVSFRDLVPGEDPALARDWDAVAQAKNVIMALRFQGDDEVLAYLAKMHRLRDPSVEGFDELATLAMRWVNDEPPERGEAVRRPMHDDIPERDLFEAAMNRVFNDRIVPAVNGRLSGGQSPYMPFVKEPLPVLWRDSVPTTDTVFDAADVTTMTGAAPVDMVVLVDVSASMQRPECLPVLQRALGHLGSILRSEDRVTIVSYSGRAEIVFGPSSVDSRMALEDAIDGLSGSGTTEVMDGLDLACDELARRPESGHRVIVLATDGRFEVGRRDLRHVGECAQDGPVVHVLHLGTEVQTARSDEEARTLADAGQGGYHAVHDVEAAIQALVGAAKVPSATDR